MRIAREQMLCIITPQWTGGADAIAGLKDKLDRLFTGVGVIHFASIGLLPPAPGVTGPPSLLLELAVDEGLRPTDLLTALAFHPSGALWDLYGQLRSDPAELPTGERGAWLREVLLTGLSVADGGFIGPRDRSVAQVRQERNLYLAAREQAAAIPAAVRAEREPFAAALAHGLRSDPQYDWAAQPAPRSFWRRGRGPVLLYLYVVFAWIYFKLSLLLWAAYSLEVLWRAPGAGYWHGVGRGAVAVFESWARLGWLIAGVVAAAVVYRVLLLLLYPLARSWRAWTEALNRELDRPNEACSARATHLLGFLSLGVLLLEIVAALAYVYFDFHVTSWPALGLARPAWLTGLIYGYAALFSLLLLLLAIGLRSPDQSQPAPGDGPGTRALKALRRRFHQAQHQETPRAQQAHPLIERCEADLVDGTAHMISLTELRWPYAWSAWWTRASLRLITSAGYAFFTEGRLGDAPGIQFSHWHIVDGGRRLLFCANFDGSFGGYLDDFINGASTGTTLIWRWSELRPRQAAVHGHPHVSAFRSFAPTRLLLFRGVKCEQRFKAYARESMLPHVYRFEAIALSVDQKNRATQLRDALCAARGNASDECIMRAIEP